jgi:hypothetical protein
MGYTCRYHTQKGGTVGQYFGGYKVGGQNDTDPGVCSGPAAPVVELEPEVELTFVPRNVAPDGKPNVLLAAVQAAWVKTVRKHAVCATCEVGAEPKCNDAKVSPTTVCTASMLGNKDADNPSVRPCEFRENQTIGISDLCCAAGGYGSKGNTFCTLAANDNVDAGNIPDDVTNGRLVSNVMGHVGFSTLGKAVSGAQTNAVPSGEYDFTTPLPQAKGIVEMTNENPPSGAGPNYPAKGTNAGATYPLITQGATEAEARQAMEQLLRVSDKNLEGCKKLIAASPPFSCTVAFDIERSFFSILGAAWSNVLLLGTILTAAMKAAMGRSAASAKGTVQNSKGGVELTNVVSGAVGTGNGEKLQDDSRL